MSQCGTGPSGRLGSKIFILQQLDSLNLFIDPASLIPRNFGSVMKHRLLADIAVYLHQAGNVKSRFVTHIGSFVYRSTLLVSRGNLRK